MKDETYNSQGVQLASVDEKIFALAQKNLVYNYNFLYFSNKTTKSSITEYNHPDGWIYHDTGTGGQVTLAGESCRIVVGSGDMTFKQALNEFPRATTRLGGQTVSMTACMKVSANAKIMMSLSDGINIVSKTILTTAEEDLTINLVLDVAINFSELTIELTSSTPSTVISISKIYANIGLVAIETLPCMVNGIIGQRKQYIATQNPPAEELSLAAVPVELSTNNTRLNSVLNGRFGVGSTGNSLLPDVRGLFSRSWDNGSSNDPDANTRVMLGDQNVKGDLVGTQEEDVFKSHPHKLKFTPKAIVSAAQGTAAMGIETLATSKTENAGESETRPKNFAELYTIKWA